MVNEKLKILVEQVQNETQLDNLNKIHIIEAWADKILKAATTKIMNEIELKDIVDNQNYLMGIARELNKLHNENNNI